MVRTEPRKRSPTLGRDALLLPLTWAAGGTDAISYLALGHVFTAMMTGNTVLLALALGQGEIGAVLRSLLALGGFMLRATVGALILQRDDGRAEWPGPCSHQAGPSGTRERRGRAPDPPHGSGAPDAQEGPRRQDRA